MPSTYWEYVARSPGPKLIVVSARSAEFTPARLAEVWNGAVARWPKPGVRPREGPGAP